MSMAYENAFNNVCSDGFCYSDGDPLLLAMTAVVVSCGAVNVE